MSKHEKIEELEQRVEELEDQTDSPEQTSKPDVSRRRMLQGAGLLGVGGLLGGSAAYSKPAQAEVADGTLRGIGQIGTPDERVADLYVDNVDNLTESETFESVSTDNLDTESHNSGWALSFRWDLTAERPNWEFRNNRNLRPISQPVNEKYGAPISTVFRVENENYVVRTDHYGNIERVAEIHEDLPIQFWMTHTVDDEWLVIDGEQNAHFYLSIAQLEDHSQRDTMEDIAPPLQRGMQAWFDDSFNTGCIWAEYTNADPEDHPEMRIIRVEADGGDSEFETVLSVEREVSGHHFHSIEHDIWNTGHMYATAGDTDDLTQWYKSEDHGKTWSEVPGTSGTQAYRTLGLSFTEEHIYWAMDATDSDGYCNFYRAERGDEGNRELLAQLTDKGEIRSFGTSYFAHPHAILITLREDSGSVTEIPLFAWDIDNEKLRHLHTYQLGDHTARQGLSTITAYPERYSNVAYGILRGDRHPDKATGSHGHGIELMKLHGDNSN